jgi:hypothetical protein
MQNSPWGSISIWHSLNGVPSLGDVHDRHSWNLPYSIFQILVTRGNNVALVLK